jgi:hypothetical protein
MRNGRGLTSFAVVATACAMLGGFAGAACAAAIDGVTVPETVQADGKTLRLNGAGLRTFSIFRVHVYVAALYLEHPASDPDAILNSPETKLVKVNFVRDVTAKQARQSWQDGLANNCRPPSCVLDPNEVSTFLARVPAMRAGERFSLLFDQRGAEIDLDDRPFGFIPDRGFAEAILATFLGPKPGSPELKRDLLARSTAQQTSR